MVERPDPESKIAVTEHTNSTAAARTDKSTKQHFSFSSTATPSARNQVTSLLCRVCHAGTGARGCRLREGTDDTGGTTVVMMFRPSCCPSLKKTPRVGVKERTPYCAPFPLGWDAGPALCLMLKRGLLPRGGTTRLSSGLWLPSQCCLVAIICWLLYKKSNSSSIVFRHYPLATPAIPGRGAGHSLWFRG